MAKSSKTAGKRTRTRVPRRKPSSRGAARKRPPGRSRAAIETALAALAHDIRTPLNGILALTELLAASELGERERAWAGAAKSAAEHLARYTTAVCDAVRAEAVGLALRQDVFSPRPLAETIGTGLKARAAIAGLTSDVAIARDLPDRVIGDPVRLRAAIENLVDNAVKFTARGGIALEVSGAAATAGRVRLIFAVTDSGIGLKPDEIKKLFRPFAQASEAVSRRYGGAGLGLTLVKRLAEAMGGDLTVTSKPGRGSTFRLAVVVEKADGTSGQKKPAHSSDAAQGVRSLKILCVEDNPYGRVVMNTILSEFGHRIDFAGTGETGVETVAREGYDLVLIDMTLPGIHGIETARRIRALDGAASRIPIVGMSGRGGPQEEKAALAAGMDFYLVKPVSPAVLAETIGKLKLS